MDNKNFRDDSKKTFAKKLNHYMNINNKTQDDIVKELGINKSTISTWCRGLKMPRIESIKKLATYFKISPSLLIDWQPDELDKAVLEIYPDWFPYENNYLPYTNKDNSLNNISNIIPLPKTRKVPRLGKIACGEPILAEENYEDYDDVPEDIKCDFTLICDGDSMINARIQDGDVVYFREQSQVENGEIAACLVDGEFETKATLKRFYKYDDKIILQAENPKYQPFVYVNEEMNKVRIIGKAVGFTSRL